MAVSKSVLFFSCDPPLFINFQTILTSPMKMLLPDRVGCHSDTESREDYLSPPAINRTKKQSFQCFLSPILFLSPIFFLTISIFQIKLLFPCDSYYHSSVHRHISMPPIASPWQWIDQEDESEFVHYPVVLLPSPSKFSLFKFPIKMLLPDGLSHHSSFHRHIERQLPAVPGLQ